MVLRSGGSGNCSLELLCSTFERIFRGQQTQASHSECYRVLVHQTKTTRKW